MLSDWGLLLRWAQQGKAAAHFGEAGVTNLLHLLRDALAKATGGPVLSGAPADARKGKAGERAAAQVGGGGAARQQGPLADPDCFSHCSLLPCFALQATARQDATLALMKELTPLLRKLGTDPVQVRPLRWPPRCLTRCVMAAPPAGHARPPSCSRSPSPPAPSLVSSPCRRRRWCR